MNKRMRFPAAIALTFVGTGLQKSSRAAQAGGIGIVAAGLAFVFFLSCGIWLPLTAQESEKSGGPRKSMVRVRLPKKGCFKACYPNKEWQEVPCLPASPYPNRPQARGKGPNTDRAHDRYSFVRSILVGQQSLLVSTQSRNVRFSAR
jgi:hypothetical protein